MKQSNKILILVAGLFLGAYFANMAYHGYQLKKKAPMLTNKTLLEEKIDDIHVVWVKTPENLLSYKFRVEVSNQKYNFKSEKQEEDFFRHAVLKGDTLFVTSKAAYVMKPDVYGAEYYLGLPNVKGFYWNGKLMKEYKENIRFK